MPPRISCVAVLVLHAACISKSDEPMVAPCVADPSACADPSSSTTSPNATTTTDADDTSPVSDTPGSATNDPATSADGDSSSSTASADESSEVSSSGEPEPIDNTYGPCATDDECTSGYCTHGFCSSVCWTLLDGETPCPAPPPDAVGITIVCDAFDFPTGQPFCEGCLDCGQYCIPQCDAGSVCPGGGACIEEECAPGGLPHCG